LLLHIICGVRVGIMFVWLSSFGFIENYFLAVLGCSFPPHVGVSIYLLSFLGLDLWKDTV
jgi:hypothetical protein